MTCAARGQAMSRAARVLHSQPQRTPNCGAGARRHLAPPPPPPPPPPIAPTGPPLSPAPDAQGHSDYDFMLPEHKRPLSVTPPAAVPSSFDELGHVPSLSARYAPTPPPALPSPAVPCRTYGRRQGIRSYFHPLTSLFDSPLPPSRAFPLSPTAARLRGLDNPDNMCYINGVMMCLLRLRPFIQDLHEPHLIAIFGGPHAGPSAALADTLARLRPAFPLYCALVQLAQVRAASSPFSPLVAFVSHCAGGLT